MLNEKIKLFAICLFVYLNLSTPALSAEPANKLSNAQALSFPEIKLKHWKASSHSEKMSFLIGFTTMIELEREWQGENPLPIEQSTVGSWARGLADIKLSEICTSLDQYAEQNPDENEKNILLVLSELYVQPKLTDAETNAAKKHYEENIKKLR